MKNEKKKETNTTKLELTATFYLSSQFALMEFMSGKKLTHANNKVCNGNFNKNQNDAEVKS